MQDSTIKEVEEAILEQYITTGDAMTVKEIRAQCKKSDTIIRNVVNHSVRINRTDKDVRIMSKDYPGCVHQHRTVAAFWPTRRWLIEVIQQTRREYDYHRYTSKFR